MTLNDEQSLDALNKAYQQGYMNGLAGIEELRNPHTDDILAAAWESGHEDGYEKHKELKTRDTSSSLTKAG